MCVCVNWLYYGAIVVPDTDELIYINLKFADCARCEFRFDSKLRANGNDSRLNNFITSLKIKKRHSKAAIND